MMSVKKLWLKWMEKILHPSETEQPFQGKFNADSDRRLARFFGFFLVLSIGVGMYMGAMEIVQTIIYDRPPTDSNWVVKVSPAYHPTPKTRSNAKPTKRPRPNKSGGGPTKGKPTGKKAYGKLFELAAVSKSSQHEAFEGLNQSFRDIKNTLDKITGLKKRGKSDIPNVRKGMEDVGFNRGASMSRGNGDLLDGIDPGDGNPQRIKPIRESFPNIRPPSESQIGLGSEGSRRSKASILRTVRRHMPGLRHIYNKHLKRNPGMLGKIVAKFKIAPSGRVVSVTIIRTTTGVGTFDVEVQQAIKRWRFETIQASGNDVVTIPFNFSE